MWEYQEEFPHIGFQWYVRRVADNQTHAVSLGDRGRFVVPSAVRERHGWTSGQALVAMDTDAGLLVMSADEALTWLRSRLEGRDLVAELLADRRAEVERETP
jgi:bifunctional DNA-binding transcriptional regulator/antitoxin component of YhaV-PrlF toxin-antitoxin module